jgi:glycosyltransferase involved in cell wall biosynthesis
MAARWRDQVEISVVAPPQAVQTVSEFLGDVDVRVLGSAQPIDARLALEYVRRSLIALLRPLPQADVALASSHFMPDASALASLVRRGALGVGYVYHLVANRRTTDPRTLWTKSDERVGLAILKRYAKLIFVSNDATGATLKARGFHPVKTAVGIDFQQFQPTDTPRIPNRGLFVGRMVQSKGVRDAIEAWARVSAAIPGARLVMAGEGPETEPARALAQQLGIASSVEFVGFVSEEEKRRLLLESSVFLAPSHEEGWGIAVGEALASRTPVVAYQLPVFDELFPSSYLPVPAHNRSALADAAARVLVDGSFAEAAVRKGVQNVSRYDLARVAEIELEAILRSRVSRSTPSSRAGV